MLCSPLESAIADYDKNFINNWNRVFSEYRETDNCFWLAGPTSYVFSLNSQKFAVDLQIRRQVDFDKLKAQLVKDTDMLKFILITHQHDDHMCLPLMKALKDTDIIWYIPKGTREDLIERSELKKDKIVWVESGDCWQAGALKIRAFSSPHAKPGSEIFPQCGYEITAPGGKILLTGDVRDYDYNGYPHFGQVDICFSHLWAGNDSQNPENYMPLLKDFVAYNAKLGAKKYYLCHLYELGRADRNLWDFSHAGLAAKMFYSMLPDSITEVPRIGCRYAIDFENGDKK